MPTKDKISSKQLAVLAFFCFFSPAVRVIPAMPTQIAGKAAWASPLIAAIPLILYIWLMRAFVRCRNEDEGVPELFVRCIGKISGLALALVYSVWFAFYAGFSLRVAAERLLSTVYEEGGISFFIGSLIIISVLIAFGNIRSLARTAQVLVPALIFIVVMMLVFSISDFKIENVWPITYLDFSDIARGAVPVLSVMGVFVYFAFLTSYSSNVTGADKYTVRYVYLALAMVFLIGLATIGSQSADLVKIIQQPFFIMVHNIRLFGVIDRMEAVVIALWVSADILLISTLFIMSTEVMRSVFKAKKRTPFVLPVAAVSLVVSFLVAQNAFMIKRWSEFIVPVISSTLFYGVIPVVFVIGKLRKKLVPKDKEPESNASGESSGGSA